MSFTLIQAQEDIHKEKIDAIYTEALTKGKAYEWLDHLSNNIGGRLSGSLNAERAVQWGKDELDEVSLDRVFLQDVMVPKWVRGTFEYASIITGPGRSMNVPVCSLGGSVATPSAGLLARVVEVKSFEELEALGEAKVKGKFVFYNRAMPSDLINTFEAYSKSVNQRSRGAAVAARLGAVGVIVRSMNLRLDDLPHTGAMNYGDTPVENRIPAAAISTNDAELLSTMLELDKNVKLYFKQSCKQLNDVQSYNVIGEITGSEFPKQYMVVGGHLDSWDLGDGSHDDGAGIVQSIEVLRLFKELGIKPKHSIRVVLFMNEENGLRGGKKYAEEAKQKAENHIFALESDSGGFSPRGFSLDCNEDNFNQIANWQNLFKPYGIHYFEKGHGGSDIGPLKNDQIVIAGLRPDSQRYFDYHHASNDTFDAINKRELELGAATMTSLVYLIDKYGVK